MRGSLVVLFGALTIPAPCLAATTFPVNSVAGFVKEVGPNPSLAVVAAVRDTGAFKPGTLASPHDTITIKTIPTTVGPFNTAAGGSLPQTDQNTPVSSFGEWSQETGQPGRGGTVALGNYAAGVPATGLPKSGSRAYRGGALGREITQSAAGFSPDVRLRGGDTTSLAATVTFGTRAVSVTVTLPAFESFGSNLVLHGKATLPKNANGTPANNGPMTFTGTATNGRGEPLTFTGRASGVPNGRYGLFGLGASSIAGTFFVITHRVGKDNYLVSGSFGGVRQ
jgi:hypothetical protein